METLNRETVRTALDRAGFNPDEVIREDYSPYPGAEPVVGLRVSRDAMPRIAEEAELLDLPVSRMSSAMQVSMTENEFDLVYFPGFRLSPAEGAGPDDASNVTDRLGKWIEENVDSSYRYIADMIPRDLDPEGVRVWLRENGYNSPLALDLVRRAEEAGVLGNPAAASGTADVEQEDVEPDSDGEGDEPSDVGGPEEAEGGDQSDKDPYAGLPPFLADLLKDAGAKPVSADDLPEEIREIAKGVEDMFEEFAKGAMATGQDTAKLCNCGMDHFPDLTDKEQKLLALGYGYRSVGMVRADKKLVELGDEILGVFGL